VGWPNVGKSSLFNRLLEQDRAIVTDIPGTTRDLVSETMDFEGIPVRIVDTAGIREADELIERLGIERSRQAMSDADLTVVVVDGSGGPEEDATELVETARRASSPGRVAYRSRRSRGRELPRCVNAYWTNWHPAANSKCREASSPAFARRIFCVKLRRCWTGRATQRKPAFRMSFCCSICTVRSSLWTRLPARPRLTIF